MNNPSDTELMAILEQTRTIAVVGASPRPNRPSHYVSLYMQARGYRIIPVNPEVTETQLFGETVYASLSDIPDDITIDMVDIFRRSNAVEQVVEEALAALWPQPKTIWMQIGVVSPNAAAKAEAAGLTVVQNRCPKIEYARLGLRAPGSSAI